MYPGTCFTAGNRVTSTHITPENHEYYRERLEEIDDLAGKLRKVVNNVDKLKTAMSFFG